MYLTIVVVTATAAWDLLVWSYIMINYFSGVLTYNILA